MIRQIYQCIAIVCPVFLLRVDFMRHREASIEVSNYVDRSIFSLPFCPFHYLPLSYALHLTRSENHMIVHVSLVDQRGNSFLELVQSLLQNKIIVTTLCFLKTTVVDVLKSN